MGGRVYFLGVENGIIAGMKYPGREIQNRAVAQPLVVGRMAAMLSGLGRGECLRNKEGNAHVALSDTENFLNAI